MWRVVVALLIVTVTSAATTAADDDRDRIDFNRDIRSILSDRCFACHGPDEGQRQTDLRLDLAENAVAKLESGVIAVVPGRPEQSELIARITSDDPSLKMPPPDSKKQLSAAEIELLRKWIEQGAPFAKHWSYEQPVRPAIPDVRGPERSANPIDRFVHARLDAERLVPSPPADRYSLIRRLSLDLTGLPPTPEDADAFANDPSPDAYERLVDRLLASPAYGEARARKWLDLARYADSAGYADDPPRTIWAYRDYVIRAFNDNTPFDEFTIEQIAGDLLPNPTNEQLVATAFHRNTLTNNEGGTNDEEFRNVAIVDRVNTTAAVWLGTTMACAQCHTHKYDPITQKEYFGVFAFFNNSADADLRDESPLLEIFTDAQKRERASLENEKRELQQQLQTPTPETAAGFFAWQEKLTAEPEWQPLMPVEFKATSGVNGTILEDASVKIPSDAATDIYNLQFDVQERAVTALRLEALADDSLPASGPGNGNGNFVVSRVSASVTPPSSSTAQGRYVRIDLPGNDKTLSLAEVQVFSGSENIAFQGKASQSSVAYKGRANRAIDGNTDGDYFGANSTTHTNSSADPWWELDLKAERPIERIAIWNRTDNGLHERLTGAKLTVFDAKRHVVFERVLETAPNPSSEVSVGGPRPVPFAATFADFSQDGFPASAVINNTDPANTGWAVSPQQGKPHVLTLLLSSPIEKSSGAALSLSIEHTSKYLQHTLGHFRVSATSSASAAERASLPLDVQSVLATRREERSAEQTKALEQHYLAAIAPELDPSRKRLAEVTKSLAELKPTTTVPVMRELSPEKRRITRLQHRGNYLDEGDEVTAGVPEAFPPLPSDAPINRLTLAKWLVSDENPLTARVAVNRMWEDLFGVGLVRTSEEFGSQGEPPSHPALLDWLAVEYRESGWDTKALLRLIVTSATYRQSASASSELFERDPENRLLARGPRFRLPAESVRDQALAVAGLLGRTMYGEPVRPPQPSFGLTAAFGSSTDWKTSVGEDRYRRGIYTTWRRSNPYPSMATFDAPNREVCTLRRPRTNTPLQALVTLNDPAYVEAAQGLARRVIATEGELNEKATQALRLCLTRPPTESEVAALTRLYEDAKVRLRTASRRSDEARDRSTRPASRRGESRRVRRVDGRRQRDIESRRGAGEAVSMRLSQREVGWALAHHMVSRYPNPCGNVTCRTTDEITFPVGRISSQS